MPLTLIALGVLALSLIGMGIIIGRKFPVLAKLDLTTPTSPLDERKKSLIEQRLRRKVSGAWSSIATATGPVGAVAQRAWGRTHQKLVELEHEYKIRSLPVFLNRRQRHKLDQEIQELLTQAQALFDDEEYPAAEEKAMQAIRLEPRSVPAFEFLGQVYLATNEPQHAKEVYRYLLKLVGESDAIHEHLGQADLATGDLKEAQHEFEQAVSLNSADTEYYLNLAKVDRMLGEWSNAFERIQVALRREPKSPKILDEYITISIGAGKKQFAEDALKQLTAVNPANAKIGPWREEIAALESKAI